MQAQLNYDPISSSYAPHTFDVMLEDADSIASIYIEIDYDEDFFLIETSTISKGLLFDSCNDGILLINEDGNEQGSLELYMSFLGEECELPHGSGQLVSITFTPISGMQGDESIISINSNSAFRDLDNNEITISNLNDVQS